MARASWVGRIRVEPAIHHGAPCITGTRIPVVMIVGSLADGMSVADVLREYPQLSEDDVRAALSYAAEVLRQDPLIPIQP